MTILKQYPKAGTKVKQNRKIYLTVRAKMPQSVKMPDLIDGSLKNAELLLSSYGLELGAITYKPDLASNAILEQHFEGETIEPGTTIPKGSVIDLIVGDGLGNRTFTTPNFLGLGVDEAAFSIIGSGLGVGLVMVEIPTEDEMLEILNSFGEVEGQPIDIMTSGHVFKQKPDVGSDIRIGEQVDLWIYSTDEEDSLRILEDWENREEQVFEQDEIDF
jgi:beta-lactam-binding protein with PASTA domain